MFLRIESCNKDVIQGVTTDSTMYEVRISNAAYSQTLSYLCKGAKISLPDMRIKDDGTWEASQIIYEPDYLIDISSLSACFTESGAHPFHYLLSLLTPKELTKYILLGNTANQFLDDCINDVEGNCSYESSIKKAFTNEALKFTVCQGINASFFEDAKKQFANIREAVQMLHKRYPTGKGNEPMLEPSFICPTLGIQGRLDYLQQNLRCLVELKSGKCEENYSRPTGPKKSHAIQMMLYKEMLHTNSGTPYDEIHGMLLYSRYPKFLVDNQLPGQLIDEAFILRNDIVHIMQQMAAGESEELFRQTTPETLNTAHLSGRLWNDYIRPKLSKHLSILNHGDDLTQEYLHCFLHFVAHEQFLSKVGNDSRHRPFANTWRLSNEDKMREGDLVEDLHMESFVYHDGYANIVFNLPETDESYIPNFRQGDMVLFYEKSDATDCVTNRQVHKGILTDINHKQITLSLRQDQRHAGIFDNRVTYAIEHDSSDSVFTGLYKGLYHLLCTTEKRRELFLGLRMPLTDTSQDIAGYYNDDNTNKIVRTVKQAKDYALIVGAPGAGKTSVVLRSIVEEYHQHTHDNILLLAYTNRAVDEICEALEHIEEHPAYIRIGSMQSCNKQYLQHALEYQTATCSNRKEIEQLVSATRIYVSTVSSATIHTELFAIKQFGIAIIDEASQILEPHLAGLLTATLPSDTTRCAIEKFVLIGDHKQLPAVALSSDQEACISAPQLLSAGFCSCKQSLFERLYHQLKTANCQSCIATLERQGRMHPQVCDFANRHFYNSRLYAVPLPHQTAELPYETYDADHRWESIIATRRTAFIAVDPPGKEEPTKTNSNEANAAAALVHSIITLYQKNGIPFDAHRSIGIIAPFRSQGACIRQALSKYGMPETSDISIDTIERYQGSQRDIIIYCTTISSNSQLELLVEPCTHEHGIIDRKMNVALTRARCQLFVIGIPKVLAQDTLYRQLIEEFQEV